MPNSFDSERKSLGLAVRTNDPMSNVGGDEQLFKLALINPVEPMGIANYETEYEVKHVDGSITIEKNYIKRNVARLVSTMALGNLNTKEVALARIFAEMSRLCTQHRYDDLAINYYLKIVHLNVTSQSHQSQLLRQILTETVSVSRKEESTGFTRDFTGEKSNKIQEFVDKWKNKDANGAQPWQTAQPQTFGLR